MHNIPLLFMFYTSWCPFHSSTDISPLRHSGTIRHTVCFPTGLNGNFSVKAVLQFTLQIGKKESAFFGTAIEKKNTSSLSTSLFSVCFPIPAWTPGSIALNFVSRPRIENNRWSKVLLFISFWCFSSFSSFLSYLTFIYFSSNDKRWQCI